MSKEECIKKLEELNNIGKSVNQTIKGTDENEEIGVIKDLVSQMVGENRYEVQRIKLHKGGIAYRLCYYTCDANYNRLHYGGNCPIINETDFPILTTKAKNKGWL